MGRALAFPAHDLADCADHQSNRVPSGIVFLPKRPGVIAPPNPHGACASHMLLMNLYIKINRAWAHSRAILQRPIVPARDVTRRFLRGAGMRCCGIQRRTRRRFIVGLGGATNADLHEMCLAHA
jgi:hypothetical protein